MDGQEDHHLCLFCFLLQEHKSSLSFEKLISIFIHYLFLGILFIILKRYAEQKKSLVEEEEDFFFNFLNGKEIPERSLVVP